MFRTSISAAIGGKVYLKQTQKLNYSKLWCTGIPTSQATGLACNRLSLTYLETLAGGIRLITLQRSCCGRGLGTQCSSARTHCKESDTWNFKHAFDKQFIYYLYCLSGTKIFLLTQSSSVKENKTCKQPLISPVNF